MTEQTRRVTDRELDRLIAGELPADRARQLESAATAADRQRLAELRAQRDQLLAGTDLAMEVAAIKQRARLVPRPRWPLIGAGFATAAAIVVAIVNWSEPPAPATPPATSHQAAPVVAIKGGDIALVVHLATTDGSRRLLDGDWISPGDRVRFEVHSDAPGYVAIFGVDGSGATSALVPYSGTQAISLSPGAGPLPGAIAFDDHPGDELLIAVVADTPFKLADVQAAVTADRPWPAGTRHTQVRLRKR